jgi:Flp pilus assembly pilin Flp
MPSRATQLDALLAEERGQTMAEYAIVLAVIAIAVIAAIGLLSGNISSALSTVASSV